MFLRDICWKCRDCDRLCSSDVGNDFENAPVERQLISPPRFAELFSSPPIMSAASKCFSGNVVDATPREAAGTFTETALGLYTAGRHRVRRKQGRRVVEGWSDPGAVNLSPANFYARWEADGSSRAIVVFLHEALLSRVITENWGSDPRTVEIVPQFLVRDPVIGTIVTQLSLEAANDSPSGLLYVESACEFLAHHLVQKHSTLSKVPARPIGGLPAHRLKAVKNYIEENLGNSISLQGLAALACISARHFERAFRQSLGVPPHRYVLERRVSAARELLLSRPELNIEEIARKVGFSSPSHLSSAFVRRVGCSPAAFRRTHS
jgi:AraC family transcriptional regulator